MKKIIVPILILLLAGAAYVFGPDLASSLLESWEEADAGAYYNITGDQAAIIHDGSVLDYKGVVQEGRAYLPLEYVKEYIDDRFYWDGKGDQILFTNAVTLYEDSISDSSVGFLQEDTLYLSSDYIAGYADMDINFYENPYRVTVSTRGQEHTWSTVSGNTAVRCLGGIRSPILTRVALGDQVEIIAEFDNWAQVCTANGHVGYMKKKLLKDTQSVLVEKEQEEPEYTSQTRKDQICLVWQQMTNSFGNTQLKDLLSKSEGVTVVSPTWYSITDNEGGYQNLTSESYVQTAHGMGLEVWALIDDFDENISILKVLSDTRIRQELVKNLVKDTLAVGADGINIDFEYIIDECGEHYIQFLRELSIRCRQEGLVLSVDNANPTYLRPQYHMDEQAVLCDYVIIMAYDEHWKGSCAGSVASLPYVTEGIENALTVVPREKLINGIPFYTRIWKEVPEEYASETDEIRTDGDSEYGRYALTYENSSMDRQFELMEEYGVQAEWLDDLGQYYVEIPLEHGKYRIWLEETKSLEEKLKLVSKNDLAGIACWKLSLESNDVWGVINKYINHK